MLETHPIDADISEYTERPFFLVLGFQHVLETWPHSTLCKLVELELSPAIDHGAPIFKEAANIFMNEALELMDNDDMYLQQQDVVKVSVSDYKYVFALTH